MYVPRWLVLLLAATAGGCATRSPTEAAKQIACSGTQVDRTQEVSPASITLSVGDTVRFAAVPPDSCGVWTPPVQWRWASASAGQVSVDSLTGLATALDTGAVVVTVVPTFDRTIVAAATVVVK